MLRKFALVALLLVAAILVLGVATACAKAAPPTPTPTPAAATPTPTPKPTPTPIVREVIKEVKVYDYTFVSAQTAISPSYKEVERPVLEAVANKSNGRLKFKTFALDELGMTGFEMIRVLKLSAFETATASPGYIGGDILLSEGIDLVGMYVDRPTVFKGIDAFTPRLSQETEKTLGIKILSAWTTTFNVLHCKPAISGLKDVKGKKVRGFGSAQSDLFNALGAQPVTLAFQEVYTALERGLVDCAVANPPNANQGKFFEVTNYLYTIPIISPALFFMVNKATWDALPPDLQKVLADAAEETKVKSNALFDEQTEDSVRCTTGQEPCNKYSKGKLTLVQPSKDDLALLHQLGKDIVLPKWVARCGPDCKTAWNDTIGKVVGYQMP